MILSFILLIVVLALIIWLTWPEENLPVVKEVNLNEFLGTWYEIARLPAFFQTGCIDSKAQYSLNSDGTVNVNNTCIVNGQLIQAKGIATTNHSSIINRSNQMILSPGRLQVGFIWPYVWPLTGDYYIIAFDGINGFMMVGEPSRNYLWILSKTKTLDPQVYNRLVQRAKGHGFPVENLLKN